MGAGNPPEIVILDQPGAYVRIEFGITSAPRDVDFAYPLGDEIVDVEAELLDVGLADDEIVVEGPEKPTPREVDVLRLVAQGYTNRQAAEALSISVRTVEAHRANLMGKLGLENRKELVRYAVENSYI